MMLTLQSQNACILDRNGDVPRDRLKHLQLIRRKRIQFLVIDREHSYQTFARPQRNRHRRTRSRLARHKVRIHADVGSIVHAP